MIDNLKANKNALRRELFKHSYYEFFKYFWSEVVTEKLVDSWHIEYLCDELQKVGQRVINREEKEYDLLINIPPASSKSTICTVIFHAWLWSLDPTIRLISSSYSESIALGHSEKTRDLVKSDKFREMYPEVVIRRDKDNKRNYSNTKGGQRFTTSTGGSVTGEHAHVIIVDDPLNPTKTASDPEIEKADKFVNSTLTTRKIDPEVTPIIMVMQRLHEEDPSGIWLTKLKNGEKVIKHICLPATTEIGDVAPAEAELLYIDGLLDPQRKSRQVLAELKIDMGSVAFSAQYGMKPSPKGGNIFKGEWFKRIKPSELPENLVWHFSVDPALKEKKQNDPTAMMAYSVDQNPFAVEIDGVANNTRVMFIRHIIAKRLRFTELLKEIPKFMLMNDGTDESEIAVEPKASGTPAVDFLQNSTDLNIVEDESPSTDKVVRANGVVAIPEAGRVFLVTNEDGSDPEWIDDFIHEIEMFPNGKHDDRVDTFVIGVRRGIINKKFWGAF